MTRQLVYIISLEDVGRIRFRCRQCDHVESTPVKPHPQQFSGKCSNCGAIWAYPNTEALEHVMKLLAAFTKLPRLSQNGLGCFVELEIAEESEPTLSEKGD